MCILLKLPYAKFDVSSWFCSKLSKKTFGGSARPPLVKEGLKMEIKVDCLLCSIFFNSVFIFWSLIDFCFVFSFVVLKVLLLILPIP